MELIIFAIIFAIITLLLCKYTKIDQTPNPEFDLTYVKGSTRDSVGMITSMNTVEKMREKLLSKHSKF